jgi:hypothetical protein
MAQYVGGIVIFSVLCLLAFREMRRASTAPRSISSARKFTIWFAVSCAILGLLVSIVELIVSLTKK